MTLSNTKARQPRSAPDTTDSAVASAPDPDSAATANSSPIEADIAAPASVVAPKKTKAASSKPRLNIAPTPTATAGVVHSGRRPPTSTSSNSATTPPKQSTLQQQQQKQLLPRIVQQPPPPPQHQLQQPAAFALPPPLGNNSECSLTRIIELYGERTDILRLVLSAKSEEDRARAEYERRVQEELRYETRRLEFEMMLHNNYFKQQERDQQPPQL
ncbi:hypothetical protein FBU31_007964, partial [Coemansia sp. 'formosensis']